MDRDKKKSKEDQQEDERWQEIQKGTALPATPEEREALDTLTNWLGGDPWHNQEEEE